MVLFEALVPSHACPGGAGVRAGGGVPAGSDADRQGAGPGRLLRDSLHRHVREDRPEDPDIRRAAPGGQTRAVTPQILTDSIKILTKDSVTVYVNAIMYYKVNNDFPLLQYQEYLLPKYCTSSS